MNISAFLRRSNYQSHLPISFSSLAFLLFGSVLGVAAAFLLVSGKWQLACGLVFILPAAFLIVKYPFLAVIIWLVLDPFLLNATTSAERSVYWMIHRALPPFTVGVLGITYFAQIRKLPKLGLAELAMIGYIGVSLFSIAYQSKNPLPTTYIFYDRVFSPMCLYFIVRLSSPGEKDIKQLVPAVFFLGITQALIGILSWISPQILPHTWLRLEGQRTTGTLVSYSDYSTTMMFVSLFILYAALNRKPGLMRGLLICIYFLSVFCVFISYSRATWLAGILILLGLIYLYPKFILRWMFIVIPAIILFVGVLFAGYFYNPFERLNERDTALSRLPTELAAYRMFEEKPIFGWGYGNFYYYDRPFQGRVADLVDARKDIAMHNLYLEILAEQGIVGLALFSIPVLGLLLQTIKTRSKLPKQGFWSRNLLFLLWLVILDHFVENNFSIMWIGFGFGIWWLTLGLIANLISRETANA